MKKIKKPKKIIQLQKIKKNKVYMIKLYNFKKVEVTIIKIKLM